MCYKRKGYKINAIKQSAYIVFDTIIVDDFAFLFNCMPLGWGSDSMMGHKAIHKLVGDGTLLSVSWPIGVELLVFFCSSVLWRCRASDVSTHCFC